MDMDKDLDLDLDMDKAIKHGTDTYSDIDIDIAVHNLFEMLECRIFQYSVSLLPAFEKTDGTGNQTSIGTKRRQSSAFFWSGTGLK
jgi:hypothetical protein